MLLNLEPGLIFWTVVTFVLLLLILRSVAWKPILGVLDEREGRIQDALDQAEKAKRDTETAAEENRKALAEAQAEAQRAIAEGRQAAERAGDDIRQRAESEARAMVEQAQRSIRQERDRAVQELHNQVAELAIMAAGKVLDENLDDDRNRKIVDDFISRIPDTDSN